MAFGVGRLRRLKHRVQLHLALGFEPPPFDGMQNLSRMQFLHDCVGKYAVRSSGVALEVGCFKGCSTVFLAKACLKKGITSIHAMDLFTGTPSWGQAFDTEAEARERLKKYDLDRHVTLLRGDAQAYPWDRPIDVFHLDADHAYEAVAKDIRKFVPFLSPAGIVVFDDYDFEHPGVKRAVHELMVADPSMEMVAVHHEGDAYGSACLRKRA